MKRITILLLALAAMTAPIFAGDPVLLGTKVVNFRGDRDEITVGSSEGRFRKLMIKVEGNDVEMYDIQVVYGNGGRDDIPSRLTFNESSRSRVIDLRFGNRVIRKIIFKYRTIGPLREGRATVSVYGM